MTTTVRSAVTRRGVNRPRVQDAPIWKHISQELRQQITSGASGVGSRLPTEHELCATYGVSRTSAIHALNALAAEGLVRRERGRGRGTTVIATADPALNTLLVPIVVPQMGHHYDPLARHLAQQLTAIQRYPLLLTEDNLADDSGWQRMFGLGGVATILYGSHGLTTAMDRHWRSLPFPVFIGAWPNRSYRASVVHKDLSVGMRAAAQLALARRCRSLVYFQHVVGGHTREDQALSAQLHALASAAGVRYRYEPVWTTEDAETVRIAKAKLILAATGPKTVVLCGADYYAQAVIAAATELGWRVGAEIGLVGCYNTPWAEILHFDSVSAQEQDIAAAVVKLIVGGVIDEAHVPSALVERGTIPTW